MFVRSVMAAPFQFLDTPPEPVVFPAHVRIPYKIGRDPARQSMAHKGEGNADMRYDVHVAIRCDMSAKALRDPPRQAGFLFWGVGIRRPDFRHYGRPR